MLSVVKSRCHFIQQKGYKPIFVCRQLQVFEWWVKQTGLSVGNPKNKAPLRGRALGNRGWGGVADLVVVVMTWLILPAAWDDTCISSWYMKVVIPGEPAQGSRPSGILTECVWNEISSLSQMVVPGSTQTPRLETWTSAPRSYSFYFLHQTAIWSCPFYVPNIS